ncbi:hypothetical protein MRY87_09800 [bacterium]|nr:hypothetical protein [bacterium]
MDVHPTRDADFTPFSDLPIPEGRRERKEYLNELREAALAGQREGLSGEVRLLSDYTSLKGIGAKGNALQRKIWEALEDSLFKRVQEALSSDGNLTVPPVVVREGKIEFQLDGDEVPLPTRENIILDPTLVSDERLFSLQLAPEPTEERPPVPYALQHPEVLRDLKALLGNMHHFKGSRLRLFSLEPPPPSEDSSSDSHPHPLNGSLVFFRRHSGKQDRLPRKRVMAVYQDVYSAHRMTQNQGEGYGRETIALSGCIAEWGRFANALKECWKADTPEDVKEYFRHEAHQLALTAKQLVRGCSARHKREAKQAIDLLDGVRDALGRENVPGYLRRVSGSLKNLRRRVRDAEKIRPFNTTNRSLFEQRIGAAEKLLENFLRRVEESAPCITKHPMLKNIRSHDATVRKRAANNMMFRLGLREGDLRSIRIRPFRAGVELIRDQIRKIQGALEAGEVPEARCSLRQMQLVAKLLVAMATIEGMKQSNRADRKVPLQQHHDEVRVLLQTLQSRNLFQANLFSPGYGPLYRVLSTTVPQLTKVLSGLEAHLNPNFPEEKRRGMPERFRAFLDSIEIESALQEAREKMRLYPSVA